VATLSQHVPSKYIRALIYSRSKVGKTFGAGTFPRLCVMDCDSGISTLAGRDFIKQHGWRPEIEYEQFVEKGLNSRGVAKSHNAFDDVCRYFDKMMTPAKRDTFETWVVDTGTTLSAFAMTKAYVLLGGTYKGISSETLNQALTHGLIFPKIQDYGSERSMVEQFVGMLYHTEKNFLFMCHEKEQTDKDGNPTAIVPLLTGKGVEAISGMFDEVWNLRVKKVGPETIRYLQTQPDGVRMAGSRDGYPDGMLWDYKTVEAERQKILALATTNKEKK
jgi:hypothetical protein